jgi:hypothetical protein
MSFVEGRPPFAPELGHRNTRPVQRPALVDANYMVTHNLAAEVAPNKPATPQLYCSARSRLLEKVRTGADVTLWDRDPTMVRRAGGEEAAAAAGKVLSLERELLSAHPNFLQGDERGAARRNGYFMSAVAGSGDGAAAARPVIEWKWQRLQRA